MLKQEEEKAGETSHPFRAQIGEGTNRIENAGILDQIISGNLLASGHHCGERLGDRGSGIEHTGCCYWSKDECRDPGAFEKTL